MGGHGGGITIDSLLIHQRENERLFCACVLTGAEDIARDQCAWLPPDRFADKRLGKFWASVVSGVGCIKAATDLGVFESIMGASVALPVGAFMAVRDYAEIIAEDIYVVDVLSGIAGLIKSVAGRDMSDIRLKLEGLHGISMPVSESADKTPDQIHGEFSSIIHTNNSFVSYGIPKVDRMLGGLFGGEVTVVAARPSMGKSAFVLQVCRNAAASGKKVLLFSLEMSSIQLWARMACPLANVEWNDVRSNNVPSEKLALLEAHSNSLRVRLQGNLIVIDDIFTVSGIHQSSLRISPDLIVIDQLPDIDWYDKKESEVVWYGKALKYMRQNIAKRMNIPMLIVHQLNRGVENRQDKHPTLSDLRMSGEIEQRSDVVLLMYRDDYYENRLFGQVNVPVEINPAKNRQGEAGAPIPLSYNLKEQWFT